jgi:Alpha-L-fucosidase
MKRKSGGDADHQQISFARRHFLGIMGGMPLLLQRHVTRFGMISPLQFLGGVRPAVDESVRGAGDSAPGSIVTSGASPAVEFYQPPRFSLMVGFIKDPQHKEYSVEQWAKNVGSKFDAQKLAGQAKSAGMVEIIWYDKWIDGLVFHKTRTTSFMTQRDFLSDLAPACRKAGLKLIIYFNTFYDGNPEFAKWSCRDQQGQPIVFSPFWPSNLLSIYSPFREKVLQQVHELFADYRVDGLWLDVPNYPTVSYDAWTREAFEKRLGKPMQAASPAERRKFAIDSITGWTQEVAAYARKLKPSAVVTYNGADDPTGSGPRLAVGMAQAVDYFSKELHTPERQEEFIPLLAQYSKPVEAGYLVSDTWFSPIKNELVRTSKSEDEMDHALSTIAGNGLNLYFAITPSHDGKFDEGTMQLLDQAGNWLERRRPCLENSSSFNDVAIVLGTADPGEMTWPGGDDSYDATLFKLETSLRTSGHLPCRLVNCAHQQEWIAIPAGVRTVIVPDRVNLTVAEREKILEFVKKGGNLLAFARGAGLGRSRPLPTIDESFGVREEGYLDPVSAGSFSVKWNREGLSLKPPLIYTQAESAREVYWAYSRTEGAFPLITRNSVGRGNAFFCAAPESALFDSEVILGLVWKETIGEPVWKVKGSSHRPAVTIRKKERQTVVNVIGNLGVREGPMQRYQPDYIRLSINSQVVPFQSATTVPENRKLTVAREGIWNSVQVYPNPSALLLLE